MPFFIAVMLKLCQQTHAVEIPMGDSMRKRLIADMESVAPQWLNLIELAVVEFTSEDPDFPIEAVFSQEISSGWRAAQPGTQVLRLIFDIPQKISRVHLTFQESAYSRTQEFVLTWAGALSDAPLEIVRQQYNFSPPHVVTEQEDYTVALAEVKVLTLSITPDIQENHVLASLVQWKMA